MVVVMMLVVVVVLLGSGMGCGGQFCYFSGVVSLGQDQLLDDHAERKWE